MGCDIHLYVERRENGQWVSADKWTEDEWMKEHYPEEARPRVHHDDRFYSGRNYDLFAILANVRNGSGFAGVITGTGLIPIAMPRGVPEDVSPEYEAEVESWGSDGHSHSWLTVRELLDYNWDQVTTKIGIVDLDTYMKLREAPDKGPDSYCGGIAGRGVVLWTAAEVEEAIDTKQEPRCTHVQMSWNDKYRTRVPGFIEETIPKLQALGEPEDVRIVFFFDN